MSASIIPFTQGEWNIRVVTIEGEPWFVLNDLVAALELTNARVVAQRLDDDVRTTYPIVDSLGRAQQTHVVSEGGLYEVIFLSRKPEAKAFKRWITHEVIPSIRKTGSYGQQLQLTEEEIVAQALQITTAKVKELEAKVEQDAPKVAYMDEFVADGDLRTLRSLASSLCIPEGLLRQTLIAHHWIYAQQRSRWSQTKHRKVVVTRYSAYAEYRQYFEAVPQHDIPRFGEEVMHTLKVTPAGAEAIARAVKRWNVQAGEQSA